MSDFDTHFYTERQQVVDNRWCEIPVNGPGLANTLVTITGIVLSGSGTNGNLAESLDNPNDHGIRGNVHIHTDYWLDQQDQWRGIIKGNTELLQATFVSLAGLANDDVDFFDGDITSGFVFAVDSAATVVDDQARDRVRIDLTAGLQGDSTLMKIAYQANILIKKFYPPATFRGWQRHRSGPYSPP